MNYDPKVSEPKWQDFWEEEGIYRFKPRPEQPVFSIDTPPPTVSGRIHIGHIFSYVQPEIVARYRRMIGDAVYYPFGLDNNGLPTERLVEKTIGRKAREMETAEFLARCAEVTSDFEQKIKAVWKSVGLSVDWSLLYSTISPEVQRLSQASFLEHLASGRIERRDAPALWCTECSTSIAQAEVDRAEKSASFYYLQFTLSDGSVVPIATTRPELLPACVAVLVHPNDTRFTHLVGGVIRTPLGDEVPVLADTHVEAEKGSGVVMCCTYGDDTDVLWAKTHHLPEKVILDGAGHVTSAALPGLQGSTIYAARKLIASHLEASGQLQKRVPITHDVGVHERCGTPVEVLPVAQWFIRILDLKDTLLALADRIAWKPEFMKERYVQWVNNLKWDWAISRQRKYGIPLPVWYSKKTGELILPHADQLPVNPNVDHPRSLPEGHTLEDILPDEGVLDTWATSSLTPQINAEMARQEHPSLELAPMSLRPQAHDIIRTWALYTIVQSYLESGEVPWERLVISGHVKSKQGEKISKSKGAADETPETLMEKHSADALRYWTCGGALGRDVAFDEKEILKGKRLITKLWNSSAFVFQNLEGFDASHEVPPSELTASDQWILSRAQATASRMALHLEAFELNAAREEFERFFWSDFCDSYLEFVKVRVYNPEKVVDGSRKKLAAQSTLHRTMRAIITMIAPYLPHIAEEIYQAHFRTVNGERSIHLCAYPSALIDVPDEVVLAKGACIAQEVVTALRKHRTERKVRLGAWAPSATIRMSAERLAAVRDFSDDIISAGRVDSVTFTEGDDLAVDVADVEPPRTAL